MKAKLATEQWHQHLEEEERERRQRFDRAHEREHEALLSAVGAARRRYAAAKTPVAIRAARSAFHSSRRGLERAALAIDPGGQSSELVPGYAGIFELLDGRYPDALLAAETGEPAAAKELEAEIDRRVKAARAWLEADEEEREKREHE